MRNIILPIIIVIVLCSTQLPAQQVQCIVEVVDSMGRPIQGAEVSIHQNRYDIWQKQENVITLAPAKLTGADGTAAVLIDCKRTENNIFAFAQKYGFAVGWVGILFSDRIPECRIVLDRINSTAGIVTDEENRPIAGATVTAYPVDSLIVGAQSHMMWPGHIFTTKTDTEGRFSFDCLADWMDVSFRVEYPGLAFRDTEFTIDAEYHLRYNAGDKNIHITMYPAGGIKGRVLAARGHKMSGIKLMARGERIRSDHCYFAVSDSTGHFLFKNLAPDTYLVSVVPEENNPDQQLTVGARVDVKVGEAVDNVKIRMRDSVKIDVLVKDMKTNQPIANANVYIIQRRVSQIIGHLEYEAGTDSRGIARVIALPGKFNTVVSCDGYEGFYGENLLRTTDTNFTVGLVPYSSVSGQIVYQDGQPAAEVEVAASTFRTERKLTGRNGKFDLTFSESSAQRGFVIARDLTRGLAGIVDITERQEPVKVVLNEAATLHGRVIDPDGNPISGAQVEVWYSIPYYTQKCGNSLYTDKEGVFVLSSVPYAQKDFSYRVSVSAYGYSMIHYEKIDVKEDIGAKIELPPLILKPRVLTVSGIAVYENGSAAAHKQISFSSRNLNTLHTQSELHTVTDENGRFLFEDACDGWGEIQCGSIRLNDYGMMFTKGGDNVTIVMNNEQDIRQVHTQVDSIKGQKLPLYEMITKNIDPEALENKKLLTCFWWMSEDRAGMKNVSQLAAIKDQLDHAGIVVIVVNARPYPVGSQWLKDHKIPFSEAGVRETGDALEFRRAIGARFLPYLILTDENKIVTHEGFDIQWIKDNLL